jgi:hypothetical protein
MRLHQDLIACDVVLIFLHANDKPDIFNVLMVVALLGPYTGFLWPTI